jgi:hypothetical protein
MDRRYVARWLAVELHVDFPGLNAATASAVQECPYLEPLNMARAGDFIADYIEDTIGARGHHIHYDLTNDAYADWKGIVRRALEKVLKRGQAV